jgi:isoquinoline 1-oxidoreductase beta subunit
MTKMTKTVADKISLSRRGFLITGGAAASGGLAIGFNIAGVTDALAQKVLGAVGNEVGAWVYIKPNDDVVVRIARSEMGQGTLTGLAQLVAEELECDWAKVKWEYPTPGQNLARARVWGDMSTGGSRGIRGSHEYVRQGGAAARQMLLQAAAADMKVPVEELTVDKGVIKHAKSNKTTTYGKVATAAAKLPVPDLKTMKLKDPKDWKIAGKPLKRLDTVDKLTGKQVYGIDLKMPGLLNASIKDSAVHGAKIKSFNGDKAKAMPGVKGVYQIGDSAVAVVAETWWQANKALDSVEIAYEDTPNTKVSSASIAELQKSGLTSTENIAMGNQVGDAAKAIEGAAKKVEATFSAPYLHHVTMEPMNCTAKWTADKCEVWVPTQNGEASLAACSAAAGLPNTKCEVYKVHLGGGFGRRGVQDYVTKAVLLAKQMPGVPVKLLYSREEDMRRGYFRPVSQARMQAGLDDKGELVGLDMRISGQSILAGILPQMLQQNGHDFLAFQGLWPVDGPRGAEGGFGYTIPNLKIDFAMRNAHVTPGFWRGVNNNQNTFYVECFMDQVAKAAGKDPLEFRRTLLSKSPKTAKHLAALNAVAAKIGWGTPPPAGVFRGIAQQMGFGSYVAAAAEVSVSDRGKLKVHRIVMGTDSGVVVNPDQVEAQVVGSVAYGLSATMFEEINIKDGAVVEQNLDTYEIIRMADFPKVETVTVSSGDFWGGVGEPTIMVAGPAVLNAIYAATGKPVQSLPLKNVKLRA